jgi:hypothetical protein
MNNRIFDSYVPYGCHWSYCRFLARSKHSQVIVTLFNIILVPPILHIFQTKIDLKFVLIFLRSNSNLNIKHVNIL